MRSKLSYSLLTAVLALGLSACGGSDDDNADFPDSYLQFYNGSPNSAVTSLREVDEGVIGSASYGDSTALFTRDAGDVDLEFFRTDSDDQEVIVDERTINLRDGQKSLIVLSGDFSTPSFNEYTYQREELENHFRLFALGLVEGQSFDLYMSDSGAPFTAANQLGTVSFDGFEELVYWDGDSDSDDFDEGEYTVYLTTPGSQDVIFESPTINFAFATEYVLAVRSTSGAIQNEVEVDLIINSSQVSNFADVDADSQFRLYNSLDAEELTVEFDGNNDNSAPDQIVAANTITPFTEIEFGDYRLSAVGNTDSSLNFNNRLVTLNQGESKAIVVYQDADGSLTSLSFEESNLPQVFDKQVQAVNLVPDFIDVDLYFVRKDETIESAEFLISSIDFGENKTLSLPSDFYELVAVFDDNEDTQVLLDRTELLGINEEENYIVTIEKTDDSPTGFKVSLLF